ncbi:MAG: hypothetical protein ACLTBS_08960 [Eisenbergiella sp.]
MSKGYDKPAKNLDDDGLKGKGTFEMDMEKLIGAGLAKEGEDGRLILSDELFAALTEYANRSDNEADNCRRAEVLGFGGRNIRVAPGAIIHKFDAKTGWFSARTECRTCNSGKPGRGDRTRALSSYNDQQRL